MGAMKFRFQDRVNVLQEGFFRGAGGVISDFRRGPDGNLKYEVTFYMSSDSIWFKEDELTHG